MIQKDVPISHRLGSANIDFSEPSRTHRHGCHGDVKENAPVSANEQLDFDHDGCDLASANSAAATVIRQLAAQLENAGYRAATARLRPVDAAERARRIDF